MAEAELTPLEHLKAFERFADDEIRRLEILQLPVRAVLATLHLFLFTTLHGRTLGHPETAGVGEATISRLSYILDLFAGLKAEPYGRDAEDAVRAFREVEGSGAQLGQLLSYAHFSQLMPEVWRGYYTVGLDGAAFVLEHPDEAFAEAQAHDILLSELGLAFRFSRSGNKPDAAVAAVANSLPKVVPDLLLAAVVKKTVMFRANLAELPMVTPEAMTEIFGFDADTFFRIQTALFGLAEVADELAMFLTAWAHEETPGEIPVEAIEWCSVNLTPGFVFGLVAEVAQVTLPDVKRFVDRYALDFRHTPAMSQGGDGFFPPFAYLSRGMLFSPSLVLTFVSARNAIYGFAKEHRQRFDEVVSQDLEPMLLHQAIEALPHEHCWLVRLNIPTAGGELDLVLIDIATHFAFVVEAKGPLPPQGARSTERLASRVREGLAQIDRFSALPAEVRRGIIEAAAGQALPELRIAHGLLVRSCFGGVDAWRRRGGLQLSSLATWSLAARTQKAAGDLESFVRGLDATLDDYFAGCAFHWENGDVPLFGRTVRVPLLKYDQGFIDGQRERAWSGPIPIRAKPTRS